MSVRFLKMVFKHFISTMKDLNVAVPTLTFSLLVWVCLMDTCLGLPDLRENSRQQINVLTGQEAILTCIVKNLENNTVIWKRVKQGRSEVLTAGTIRVTSDSRFSVVHSQDANEWILSIVQSRISDSAQYVCEVNSSPTVKVSHLLTVTAVNRLPLATPFSLTHNFTECCIMKNVPDNCLGFCSLQNIVVGSTGTSSHDCEDHLASIAFCMADGRNHEPCCIRERIPEACREVCRGEYTLQTASVLHHYACSHYSSATLACIAQGVELLPGPPQEVVVEPVSDREIKVKWKLPRMNGDSVTHYILNVTELRAFDELESAADVDGPMGEEEEYFPADGVTPAKSKIERQGRNKNFVEKFTEIKLNGTETSTVLKDLKPYTMYEIYLLSVNVHGSSLPTYRVRSLTLMPPADRTLQTPNITSTLPANLPELPDVRGCCEKQGLPMENCVNRFCDPRQTDDINLTDMMICAPWVTITIPCLTQGRDHTPCCVQRGLPSLCLNLCHGNITRIDYQYFQCLPYMAIYANCLMEGYGVLTSAPKDLMIKHMSSSWAVLHWESPDTLADTVVSYNVHYRSLSSDEGDGFYTAVPNAQNPYLLSDLKADTNYEVYVRSVNQYGVSQASSRLLFRTEKVRSSIDDSAAASANSRYNMTECCLQSGVNSICLPLCSFRAKLSEVKDLVPICLDDMHRMLRCGAGGRNHMPCCERRRVNAPCLEMCAGFLSKSATAVASACVGDLISIVECMEEGTDLLPSPVTELQVVNINSSAVHLEWEPPKDSNASSYEIHYEIWNNDRSEKVVKVNETSYYLTDLDANEPYAFYVVSVNEFGSSIASSLVHLNLSFSNEGDKNFGTPSPPEGLTLRDRNTTSLTLVWLPPAFTHPLDHLRYKLYYRIQNQSVPHSLTTTSLGAQLNELIPGTEYEVYVTALTDKGESPPAESLLVLTDTAYPAYVEVPNIHPSGSIEEGINMTVLCVAMGTPTPVVSVFVGGILYAQDVTRHMVAVVPNVTREMDTVTCHAENGQGAGWQATRKLQVSYGPNIEVAESVETVVGKLVILTCLVSAFPAPHMAWWRDAKGEHQIANGDRHLIRSIQDESGGYSIQLTIVNTTVEDAGSYYCHAENSFGRSTEVTDLKIAASPTLAPSSVRDCCIEQNVATECLDTCTYEVDVDAVVMRSKCIPEIHKLMYCAADGSDHRRCCLGWGVPRRCIGWCQGKAIHHGAMCVLVWSKQIISCFQEGRDLLPGPPQNVRVQQVSDFEAKVSWDPPLKNPNTVDYYRISWKKTAPGRSIKDHNETHENYLMVNLKSGAAYEFSVKAVNRRGSSSPSSPVKVEINGVVGSLESAPDSEGEQVGLVIGLVIGLLVLGFIGAVGFLHYRRNIRKLPGGVSFENPSYMKDGTSDTVQIANSLETNGGVHFNNVEGWKSETLHVAEMSSGVSGGGGGGGHYEELKNETSSGYKNSKEIL